MSRILEEISKQNFENVGTKDLISIAFTIENKLKESISDIELHTGINEDTFTLEDMFKDSFKKLYANYF